VVTIKVHAAGDETCDKAGVDLLLSMRTGVDDVPNASNVDHADTKISPWTPTGTGAASLWGRASDATGNTMFFGVDSPVATDTQFVSPTLNVGTTQNLVLKFNHAFDLEASGGQFFDGGVVEISLNGGTTWSDVSAFGVTPGYTNTLFVGSGNVLGGRMAYTGTSPGFPALAPVSLDFGKVFAGLPVMFRFRIGSDASVAQTGWLIDDVEVDGITNTPFPALVTEPSTCTARRAEIDEPAVVATRLAPRTSLTPFDNGVCILQDAP
jgi:hypothetical protein